MEKEIKFTKKQDKEFKKIIDFFMEAVVCISIPQERYMTQAKILSHLACFKKELTYGFSKSSKRPKK